ncbi:DUF4352 domain-containing protein [Nonomuraea sp. NPDC050643]|uniref:DUF4352 domain-containing protein n=1 Tax=Nonomuraea sp. NPDC050643 TaxID=3155660 RepID=UPI00340DCCE0
MAHPGSPPRLDLPADAGRGRKKTIIVLSVVVAVAVLIAAAALIFLGGEEATSQGTPREVGIGIATEDGALSFSVVKLQWSEQVGNAKNGTTAQGRFLLVHVMVLNTGEEPETYRASAQKLYAGGREYATSAKAATYLRDSSEKVINPGDSLVVFVPFDLPRNVTPDSIELHTTPDSTGIRVTLR